MNVVYGFLALGAFIMLWEFSVTIPLLIRKSKLVKKYNETIDRESAYEMLNEKIDLAEAEEAKEKAKQEREALKKAQNKQRTTRTRRKSTVMNPIVKVLTSATFIRSVFGILTKVMKK